MPISCTSSTLRNHAEDAEEVCQKCESFCLAPGEFAFEAEYVKLAERQKQNLYKTVAIDIAILVFRRLWQAFYEDFYVTKPISMHAIGSGWSW